MYGHLGSLVHTNPMVQEHLGPALLSVYIAVDQIEGLDVDKEEFDKYGARLVGGADAVWVGLIYSQVIIFY